MEVNKDEAERCKVIGANAMKQKQYERAAKFFRKSLSLYPLPGVEALLSTAERMVQSTGDDETNNNNNRTSSSSSTSNENDANTTNTSRYARSASTASTASSTADPSATAGTSSSGRTYTQAHVEIVEKILTAKATGGRTAHYKVLGISATACTESDIKKAYRKLAIKVHPDKNSAPKADEAFKAVGLAYATLSDPQKKAIYDRYGDEDPDNRGGGGGGMRHHRGPGGMHFRPGDEVSPEDIFNMFFGGMAGGPGGMHRGPGGMHFYTNFGGPAGGFARAQQQQQRQRQQQQRGAGPAQDDPGPGIGNLIQLLPFLLIMALSFMNMTDSGASSKTGSSPSVGENRYFSLTVSVSVCHPNVRIR
jgi:DnaJ family protein B protein 12